ncbi:Conserved_hypothetical protein [Hexamita inflata]|uniref:Uncharacterized protein n=1 Tax=Hexamita inflata TaxID=28002 RepID=A0AA86NFB3_9EUKA|nr:Conserved hypothetical protein [Hexamita inflata]
MDEYVKRFQQEISTLISPQFTQSMQTIQKLRCHKQPVFDDFQTTLQLINSKISLYHYNFYSNDGLMEILRNIERNARQKDDGLSKLCQYMKQYGLPLNLQENSLIESVKQIFRFTDVRDVEVESKLHDKHSIDQHFKNNPFQYTVPSFAKTLVLQNKKIINNAYFEQNITKEENIAKQIMDAPDILTEITKITKESDKYSSLISALISKLMLDENQIYKVEIMKPAISEFKNQIIALALFQLKKKYNVFAAKTLRNYVISNLQGHPDSKGKLLEYMIELSEQNANIVKFFIEMDCDETPQYKQMMEAFGKSLLAHEINEDVKKMCRNLSITQMEIMGGQYINQLIQKLSWW